MTETLEPKISEGFALSSQCDLPTPLDLSAVVDDEILSVESIVAAMLSDKHNLSAEELAAFEQLLDAPDVDPAKRQELLQTLWNIVVCLIDFQWDNAVSLTSQNSCGSMACGENDLNGETDDVIKSTDHNLTHNHKEAAAEAPGQKGPR